MKIDAVSLSWAGDKYLGRSYKEMDCQEFMERCMADVGYRRDLAGSNAWYRAMTWTGTPEECKRVFGEIPKGAFLFILEQNGREPEKYRKDGIGNASHIGMKTGRNDGAIHSSSSRGKVATSVFRDKTIKNGGWNRVGLLDVFDYGKSVNWVLEHIGIGQEPAADPDPAEKKPADGGKTMRGKVYAENGGTVKLRQKPSTGCGIYWDIPVGTEMEILEQGDVWSRCTVGGRTGWMKNEFVQLIEEGEPAAAPDPDDEMDPDPVEDFTPGNLDDDGQGYVTLCVKLTQEEAQQLLPIVDKLQWNLVQLVGRG